MSLLRKLLNKHVRINFKENSCENNFHDVLLSGFDSHFFHLDNNENKLYSISSILTIELAESQEYEYNGSHTISKYNSYDDQDKSWLED
ncbi:MAG: hypothetical protein ACRC4T_08185 [Cetobacterium sp.]